MLKKSKREHSGLKDNTGGNSMKEKLNISNKSNDVSSPQRVYSTSVVYKSGYARKLKKMKRKFFVLHGTSETDAARLLYYDSEKKWLNNLQPKRTVILKDCFGINRRMDTKHQNVIALYTKDDCFSIVFDTESDMSDWLSAMLELQRSDLLLIDEFKMFPSFEYIWQITIKNKGLSSERNIIGAHRLCLSAKALTLVKMGNMHEEDMLEFPLLSVRRCGHTDSVFFMELGRSAVTGAGELWMQTEDTIIAQNMHEAILSAMKNSRSLDENSSKNKMIRSRRSTNSMSEGSCSSIRSSTLRNDNMFDSTNSSGANFRPRTVSEGHDFNRHRRKFNRRTENKERPQSFGPPKAISVSDDMYTDNGNIVSSIVSDVGKSGESTKADHHPSLHGISNLHKTEPTISEEGDDLDDYLPMNPAEDGNIASNKNDDDYMPMNPANNNYGGRVENPGRSSTPVKRSSESQKIVFGPMRPTNLNSSGARPNDLIKKDSVTYGAAHNEGMKSPVGSPECRFLGIRTSESDEGYIPMTPGVSIKCSSPMSSSLNSSVVSSDGYMNMTGNSSVGTAGGTPTMEQQFSGFHLDKVQSYVSELPDSVSDQPIRSYSVGAATKSKLLLDQQHRTRAFSCGSRDDKSHMKSNLISAQSTLKAIEDNHKSVSTPDLPDDKHPTYGGSRREDLMELEFMHETGFTGMGSPTSSYSSVGMRSRSSSKSSTGKLRASAGRNKFCENCELDDDCDCSNSQAQTKSNQDVQPSDSGVQQVNVPKFETTNGYMLMMSGTYDGLPKGRNIKPSQELVRQLQSADQTLSARRSLKNGVQGAPIDGDRQDNSGDYINIDLSYNKDVFTSQHAAMPKKQPSQTTSHHSESKVNDAKNNMGEDGGDPAYVNLEFCKSLQSTCSSKLPSDAECGRRQPIDESKEQCSSSNAQFTPVTNEKSLETNQICASEPCKDPASQDPTYQTSINATHEYLDCKVTPKPPSSYENVALPSNRGTVATPRNSRPSSVSSELEINYASLDLAPTGEDDDRVASRASPHPSGTQIFFPNVSSNSHSDETDLPSTLSYAEIDFKRSEGLRTTTNAVVESRH